LNKKNSFIILLPSFLIILFGYVSNSAYSQEKKDQEVMEYEVSVTLKLVQVYVMDSDGNPVMDLEKEDFELYDNGKPQSITDIEKHILFMPSDKTRPQQKEETPSRTKLNRKIFLFFDFAFNSPRGIKNAKEAALYFIDHQLDPSDEVGVLSYSITKYLTVHENLTTNHKKVREAVEGLGIKGILGRAEDVEQKYWEMVSEIDRNPNLPEIEKISKENDFIQLSYDRIYFKQHVSNFSRTMKELGQALSHIQGRKNILYLSTGIPGSIFEGGGSKSPYHSRKLIFKGAIADTHLNDRYEEMIKILAASNSSVYPIYAEGTSMNLNQRYGFQDKGQLGKSSLQRMAIGTGGRYFGNINSYETIMEEIQSATSSFYVLGYYIGEKWDGKYHRISVKVRRKGCKVRSQAGYFNPKPFSELSEFEKELDFIELALEESSQYQAPLSFPVGTISFSTERISGLVTISKIAVEKVRELSGKKVEFINLIFDEKDDLFSFKGWRINLAKLPQNDIFYYSLASLPPGKYTSRIVIRNTKTGKSAVSSSQVIIQRPLDSGLNLSSPLLLVSEKSPVYLKGGFIEQEDEDKKSIDLIDLYSCNLKLFAPVVKEIEQGIPELTAVIRSYIPQIQYPDMKISLRVMDQSLGEIIPIHFSVLHQDPKNHIQISFIILEVHSLKPGNYIIYFDAEETKTRLTSQVSITFSIK
jgi:VWFA-related protein